MTALTNTFKRACSVGCQLVIVTMGLVGLFGMNDSRAAPSLLGPPEAYFDPQSAALLRAAMGKNAVEVRELITAGANPNSQGPHSNSKNTLQITLLGYAIVQRSQPALKLLIEAGANPLFAPRDGGRDAFSFAIIRNDGQMLEALYRSWPLAKVPAITQKEQAFEALKFDCISCVQVMLENGLPVGIQDERGYNLVTVALAREDFEFAEWLIEDVGVPLDAVSSGGVTPANHLQNQIGRYSPGTPIPDVVLRLQALMQTRGIVFPVETSAQWRAVRGIK